MPLLKNARYEAFARRRVHALLHPESLIASVKAVAPALAFRTQEKLSMSLPRVPEIVARIQELSDAQDRRLAQIAATLPSSRRTLRDMELQEFVDYLVGIITTPLGEIDENSPLAQDLSVETGKGGAIRKRVKIVSREAAAALLAKVKGWTQEAAVSISFPGFVATVRDVNGAYAGRLPDGREAGREGLSEVVDVPEVETVAREEMASRA